MSEDYKSTVKRVCNEYGLTPFLIGGELYVYQHVEEALISDDPITIFCYSDPDTWSRDSIESQVLEALLTHGF